MALPQGINCRANLAYVTDPTNCWFDDLTVSYPRTSGQGNTVGTVPSGAGFNILDRNSSLDPRLAGIWYLNTSDTDIYRIDLPSAGTYSINLALGDASAGNGPFSCEIHDNTTLLWTVVTNVSQSSGQWYDATGTLRTSAADWVTANPQGGGGSGAISLTFATTAMRVYLIGGTGFPGAVISHIWVMAPTGFTSLPAFIECWV